MAQTTTLMRLLGVSLLALVVLLHVANAAHPRSESVSIMINRRLCSWWQHRYDAAVVRAVLKAHLGNTMPCHYDQA